MAADNTPNGRVTVRDLYDAIREQDRERAEMERRLNEKLDCLPKLLNQVETNKCEIDKLRNRDTGWNIINSVGVALAAILGIKYGGP